MIILASASKKRSQILSSCRIKHRVFPSKIKEDLKISKLAHRIVMLNAKRKAEEVSKKFKRGFIIGADTICVFGKRIIGKLKDVEEAKKLLSQIQGKFLWVYTGLCLIDVKNKRVISDYEKSKVKVKPIEEKEISKYIRFLSPFDKAGGFSIEGAGAFIFDDIRGSYFNVLGLPLSKLRDMFEKIGFDLLSFCKPIKNFNNLSTHQG
jgi:septum formation protein